MQRVQFTVGSHFSPPRSRRARRQGPPLPKRLTSPLSSVRKRQLSNTSHEGPSVKRLRESLELEFPDMNSFLDDELDSDSDGSSVSGSDLGSDYDLSLDDIAFESQPKTDPGDGGGIIPSIHAPVADADIDRITDPYGSSGPVSDLGMDPSLSSDDTIAQLQSKPVLDDNKAVIPDVLVKRNNTSLEIVDTLAPVIDTSINGLREQHCRLQAKLDELSNMVIQLELEETLKLAKDVLKRTHVLQQQFASTEAAHDV